jgi:hypothetical protein
LVRLYCATGWWQEVAVHFVSGVIDWLGVWQWYVYASLFVAPCTIVLTWRFVHRPGQTPQEAHRPFWFYVLLATLGPLGLGLVVWVRWLYRDELARVRT